VVVIVVFDGVKLLDAAGGRVFAEANRSGGIPAQDRVVDGAMS